MTGIAIIATLLMALLLSAVDEGFRERRQNHHLEMRAHNGRLVYVRETGRQL